MYGHRAFIVLSNHYYHYGLQTVIKGLTGEIKFDNKGIRSQIQLDVLELQEMGLQKVGSWNNTAKLNMTRDGVPSQVDEGSQSLSNTTFTVITSLVSNK